MNSLTIIFILNGVFFISFFLLKNIYVPLVLSLIALFLILHISKQKKIISIHESLRSSISTLSNTQRISAVICLVIFIILEKFIGFNASLFSTFLIFSYLNKLEGRTSFFIALVLLIMAALSSIGGKNKVAEDIVVMVYNFLIIGTIWQVLNLNLNRYDKKN